MSSTTSFTVISTPYEYDYAGEDFLTERLPNYPTERRTLVVKLISLFIFWIFLFPLLRNQKKDIEFVKTGFFSIIGLISSLFLAMIIVSPDNRYTPRAILELPLFTRDECDHIVIMVEKAAQKNHELAKLETLHGAMNETVEDLLKDPVGWRKKRHGQFPTTDLNVVNDPFTENDRNWLQEKFDARLSPSLERIYGVPRSSIRARDIFVVRYDAGRQQSLSRHTDGGFVTCQVLLSDSFDGGGTRFWNRWVKEPFALVRPKVGQMTFFSAAINHEGIPISRGRRYLLVLFLNLDRINLLNMEHTGLSWAATWGSVNWAAIRFNYEFRLIRHKIQRGIRSIDTLPFYTSLLFRAVVYLTNAGDYFSNHFLQVSLMRKTE